MTDLEARLGTAIEALASPAQRIAARHHLERGDLGAVLMVLGAPPEIYAPYDAALATAFLAGFLANLKD